MRLRDVLLAASLALASACSNSSFSGSSGKTGAGDKDDDDDNDNDGDGGDATVDLGESAGPGTGTDQGSGTGVTTLQSGEVRESFTGPTTAVNTRPADIIFAMDTSGSMRHEKATLEQKMAVFVQKLETDAASLDFHIYAIGDGFNFPPSTTGRLTLVDRKVSSHNALAVLQEYFSGLIPGAAQPRADALKAAVVFTDDEAEGVTSLEFKQFVDSNPSLQGKFSFNALVGLPTSVNNGWCSIVETGNHYITLGQDPGFGRRVLDLCSENWDQLLTEIASGIISDVGSATFRLARAADLSRPVTVTVNGTALAAGTYQIDATTGALSFAAGQVIPPGATIVVTYFPR